MTGMTDELYMRRALALAAGVEGRVSPRPPVGAVVVSSEGRVVGEGATTPSPGPHAEVVALDAAGSRAAGGTVYVSLEPCAHTGATGPCAEALVRARVARVVAATRDPNPQVDGDGLDILRDGGVEVIEGVCEEDARTMIAPFDTWVRTGRPFVTLKLASTLDGKVAAPDGTSRWITGDAAREEVHHLRRRADAVLVGAGTAEADDPRLTCRLPGFDGSQPRRVLVDSSGRTPPAGRLFDRSAPTTVLTTDAAPAECRAAWSDAGAEVVGVSPSETGVDLHVGLRLLGDGGICHVLCEGGPTIAASLVAAGLVDRILLYLAPKLVGGDAPGILGWGVKTLADAWELEIVGVERIGDDLRLEARPEGS